MNSTCSGSAGTGLLAVFQIGLGLATLSTSITLGVIIYHRHRFKRHHIFPFNIILSDFIAVLSFDVYFIFLPANQISDAPLKQFPDAHSIIFTIGWICNYESIISTLLVAIYQFVSIRLDPFSTRHIITTSRCVATCVVTWVIIVGLSALYLLPLFSIYNTVVFGSILVITTTCYVLIYHEVSKVPCTDNVQLQQRKVENMRVLSTFGLILCTSVACWVLPLVDWVMIAANNLNGCLEIGANIMICTNLCANSLIYWWRLNEFRSAFSFRSVWTSCHACRHRGIRPQPIAALN